MLGKDCLLTSSNKKATDVLCKTSRLPRFQRPSRLSQRRVMEAKAGDRAQGGEEDTWDSCQVAGP